MTHTLDARAYDVAFASGAMTDDGRPVQFELADAGFLRICSGKVAASDPLVSPDPTPFSVPVPNGLHPVTLAIARLSGGDERIAFARLLFGAGAPVKWQMAVMAGQDAKSLKDDEYFGYGVDSGTGCFMDPESGALLRKRMDGDDDYFNTIIEGMEATYKHTRSWYAFRPDDVREENVICFSSGFGDGSYPTYVGTSAAGEPVVLVTDFFVLQGNDVAKPGKQGKPIQNKPWWKFWTLS